MTGLVLHRNTTVETVALRTLAAATSRLAIGDLARMEVLPGARSQNAFAAALPFLESFHRLVIADHRIAVEAARHYRDLRARGITIRRTIATLTPPAPSPMAFPSSTAIAISSRSSSIWASAPRSPFPE